LALDWEAIDRSVLLLGHDPEWWEAEEAARDANRLLLNEIEGGHRPGWKLAIVPRLGTIEVANATLALMSPYDSDRRLLIAPFGPKPLVLSAALTALTTDKSVWFSYPVPYRYDADHTIGTGDSFLFQIVGSGS
jgi:hypothetical protein